MWSFFTVIKFKKKDKTLCKHGKRVYIISLEQNQIW